MPIILEILLEISVTFPMTQDLIENNLEVYVMENKYL